MELAGPTTVSSEPLRVLSLDGGGIRGLSSLLILERIMVKVRDARHLSYVPRPCDHFDLIGGTSTGGIIAIMLGRLGMTVDECIRAYRQVAQQAFTPKRTSVLPPSPTGAFSAKALEDAMKSIVREYCTDIECVARRREGHATAKTCPHDDLIFRDQECTKTVVLAITKDNVDAPPTLFTTYDPPPAFEAITLWQVARATSAATTFFKSISVGRDGIQFIDAGFGYNNPCDILVQEAQRVFPERRQMQILSIGTGLGDVVMIKDKRLSIITALKKMASSSKKVAASMDHRYSDGGKYYRFNVDQGLQDITLSDWEKASTISSHTNNYLAENERKISKFVDDFTRGFERQMGIDKHIVSILQRFSSHYIKVTNTPLAPGREPVHLIQFPQNHRFVGREEKLEELKQKMFTQKNNRRVAVFGLGGVGKTQVALQLAHWTKQNMPTYSIFWIPALSDASFEHACTQIATKLGVGKISDNENAMELVQRHLSSEAFGPWLLIVDNADDLELLFGDADMPGGLSQYLPDSENGMTLLTTRFRKVAVSFAANDVVKLEQMSSQEANNFLEGSLIPQVLPRDQEEVTQLLEELNYLPLAITQAAAYMNTADISISKYRKLLRSPPEDVIRLMSRRFHDSTRYRGSQNAVATTWLISFQQIQKTDNIAAKLLAFISCIEPKAIPQDLLPDFGSEEETVHAIGILCGYAFLVKRNDTLFDMHSLVHMATQNWVREEGSTEETIEMAIHHIAAILPDNHHTNRGVRQAFLPHGLQILQRSNGRDMEARLHLNFKVGWCLRADGRFKEATKCYDEAYHWAKLHYIAEHPTRLASQHKLARIYRDNGRISKALELLEHVLTVKERTLAEEHPSRLDSQHELAGVYLAHGQISKALELMEHVVTVHGRTLAEEHPNRLLSQHELAVVYLANSQISKALELLEYVVTVKGRTLAEEHPDRLVSQHELARVYFANGQISKALELLEHVVIVQGRTMAEEHPSRLASQHELAGVYLDTGQINRRSNC
ncbi:uncharacterized protein N7482_004650 [Penicillium canariense]|uniref:PNPLA domain-containing protein n=1 Tax=Penicillium canariense TaxID=189055 RepID=A0A9W9I6Z8_9EURO|nr:uncharacterized protein N7482_004650 [Penicillium canariense]KAJ5169056.1 hypothetical protein N7482_004650 [Penicillium canariense]